MSEVHAVKDDATLARMAEVFASKPQLAIYGDIWKIGSNVALRIGDLLKLRYSDVQGDVVWVTEEKTGNRREVPINANAQLRIMERRAAHPSDEWLFQNNSRRSKGRPVTRQSVHRIFKEIGERESINVKLGTHSMRKTWGYRRYAGGNGYPIQTLVKAFGHADAATTLKYIGIDREEIFAAYDDERYMT